MNRHHPAGRVNHAGLWDWNLVTNRVHFSPRWVSMVGGDGHHAPNTPDAWLTRVHPDDITEVRRQMDEHLAGGAGEFDLPHRLRHRDGTYRWTSCQGVVVRNESGQAVRVMGRHSDVTAEKVADAMTGLPNRLLFMDHLARAIDRARRHPAHRFALLLVDLGRPDRPEDEAGERAPDALLTAAARRLETCLRADDGRARLSRDHLVARLRGDEFAILLDGLPEIEDARVVGDRVLAEILAPFMVGADEVFLTSSIGIALSATGYTRAEEVLRDADTALHRAKQLGRARSEVFDTAILKSARAEVQLEADFEHALGRREFVLHYQPVVSLITSRIAGFEALVRWQHPNDGLIAPAEFIPIAEKTGLIVPLGQWIVREACLQLRAWQESMPDAKDVWVSLNLSPTQLNHPALVDDIGEALRDTGLHARCLVLELTEGVAMDHPTAVKSVLMRLRCMGARVALDDFGTGQSSLAHLYQFPADTLKLDRSFVRDMEARKEMRDIVGAVTSLAHQLGLQVIAEGVESDGQLALVRSLGCEYVQGFLYSKPLDKERAAELLRACLPLAPERNRRRSDEPKESFVDDAQGQTGASRRPRPLYVAAAAVATLACAGVVALFTSSPPAPAGSAGRPAGAIAREPPPAPAVEPPAPRPVPEQAGRRSRATPAASPATVTPGTAAIRGPAEGATPASKPVAPAVKPLTYSLAVVHKHALRGCQGVLAVSGDGIAFVPDKEGDKAKDAFSFGYGEFEYSLSDDELIIESAAKTYRFKAAGRAGKDGGGNQLQEAAAHLQRQGNTPSAR